ncbi:uncharacterized protein LOC119261805 [Pygocentrus nattereri]|uniref:uncharacterized protein LOC119261805 n=1 Tax=Pygocentrus nattereri TaxID=42514 RepID=UPI0018918514|nr:uncharacterized protein LOC119261805 [Pygocentrus nattereri]
MQPCSSALCILILLISTFTTGSESCFSTVKVGFNQGATLSCSDSCSGLARWTVFNKPTDSLAECDQISCRSLKEGYEMIHDQYLKKNISLIITKTDYSKKGRYTCKCDSQNICDVDLQVEPLRTTVQIEPGQSLVLKIDITDPVEVVYSSTDTDGPSSGQICTVDGRSLQCDPEHTERASLTSVLELRNMTPSDSGDYSIVNKEKKQVIHIYTVTVKRRPAITCRTRSPRCAGCVHGCLLAGITFQRIKLQKCYPIHNTQQNMLSLALQMGFTTPQRANP